MNPLIGEYTLGGVVVWDVGLGLMAKRVNEAMNKGDEGRSAGIGIGIGNGTGSALALAWPLRSAGNPHDNAGGRLRKKR